MIEITNTPLHCGKTESNCTYLGTVVCRDVGYDLYYKNTEFEQTLIARYGPEGEYISGTPFGRIHYENDNMEHPLAIAYSMCLENGQYLE